MSTDNTQGRCPVCSTEAKANGHTLPYHACPGCGCWFRPRAVPATVDAPASLDKAPDESEAAVLKATAERLVRDLLGGTPATTLSTGVGSAHLAYCFRQWGCASSTIDDRTLFSASPEVQSLEAASASGTGNGTFHKPRLITVTHLFERLEEPLLAIRALRALVADDGYVFLRLASHEPGVSPSVPPKSPGEMPPVVHTVGSILELLAQAGDCFALRHAHMGEQAGSRDFVLEPISRRPTIGAGMIVTTAQGQLARCLESIAQIVDGVVVVDTEAANPMLDAAATAAAKPVRVERYREASRQDSSGNWKLWDHAKARNRFVDILESATYDWLLWMDPDETLRTPAAIRRAVYWTQHDAFGVWIDDGVSRWLNYRLWKTGLGIRFEGQGFERPACGRRARTVLDDATIVYDATPESARDASASRLRILEEEWARNPRPGVAFELGDAHGSHGSWAEAANWYQRRIEMTNTDRDEWLKAWLQLARTQRAARQHTAAARTLRKAVWHADHWAEFWMELSLLSLERGELAEAKKHAQAAVRRSIAPVTLFPERSVHSAATSWTSSSPGLKLGDATQDAHADQALQRPEFAPEWSAWTDCLKTARATAVGTMRPAIAVHRPGAIGDILMTLNLIPLLRATHFGRAIHYFCHPGLSGANALRELLVAAGVDAIEDHQGFWSRQGEFAKAINLIGYPLAEGYPERPMRKHLIEYFADEMSVPGDDLPALRLSRPARPVDLALPDRYATLQAKAGWSVYKNWPLERWQAALRVCPDIPVVQLGQADEPRIPGAIHTAMGKGLPTAIAVFANARMHLGIDSYANHLTHYLWQSEEGIRRVPGVILWGSTQVSASGYAHNTNVGLTLPCQPCFREDPAVSTRSRGPCINPPGQVYEHPRHACMHGIEVDAVVAAIKALWHRVADGDA